MFELGKIEHIVTPSGQRKFHVESFLGKNQKAIGICYCRVSSPKQRDDLERQIEFMQSQYPEHLIIKDIGSGLNFKRQGLRSILGRLLNGDKLELVVAFKIALPDLDSSCSNTLSSKMVEKSWFSTKQYIAPKTNSPKTYLQSSMSLVAGCTDLGNTRTRKIRFYPNRKQKMMLKQWLGVSRLAYNKTISYLKLEGRSASWKAIKTDLINGLPEFAGTVPYQIKSIAVKDACDAVKKAKTDYLRTGQIHEVKFRSKKQPYQSFYLPKSAIKEQGFYIRLLGKNILFAESIPNELMDSRITFQNGRWFVCIPTKITIKQADNQGRVVSLDPGIRTFLSFYSETSCGHLGQGDFGRIQRLSKHLDDLISSTSKAKGAKKCRMKKAQIRMRNKISDLIDELHHKAARFLVRNFDVILLPSFNTKDMVCRAGRKIRAKSVRAMLTFSHYKFKTFLKNKAFEHGKNVIEVNEAYTSKTVSWTGEIVSNLGGAKVIKSKSTGLTMDRDLNGARGILLRALVDAPTLSPVKYALVVS